jgi:hypothetical protein
LKKFYNWAISTVFFLILLLKKKKKFFMNSHLKHQTKILHIENINTVSKYGRLEERVGNEILVLKKKLY